MNETSNETSSSQEINYKEDLFCWTVEGIGILIIGLIGVFGNSCSMVLFSQQKVHRIFHHLLLLLSVFDLMYVVCSVLLFSLSKFIEEYDLVYRIYLLPYLLPMAHVGLMGSVYCTLALTIERFLAVCYPFLKHRNNYTSKTFVLPVMIFTLVYNLPKFFELYVKKDVMLKSVDCLEIMENQSYIEYRHNCTTTTDDWEDQKVNVTVLDHNDEPQYKISITATDLRINRIYIRVYILWLNLIVQIIVPFVLLTVLNILTYKKIVEFEQNLSNQMRERNTRPSMRRVTSQRVRSQDGEENDTEMIQLVSEQEEDQEEEISRSGNLLQRIKSIRGGGTNASNGTKNLRQSAGNSSIVSGQANSDLRKKEVVLAKISLYMVFVFLICHSVKIVPNIFEMVQTYYEDYHPNNVPWPAWLSRLTNISHFLLTFACSANFYIYFAKHSQRVQRLFRFRKLRKRKQQHQLESGAQELTTFQTIVDAGNNSREEDRTRSYHGHNASTNNATNATATATAALTVNSKSSPNTSSSRKVSFHV